MILGTRYLPQNTQPTKARHSRTSPCQVHLPPAWCTVRRLWVNVTIQPQSIWNMLETQFYCQAKAKKPSAEHGLGLQTWSFALVPVTLIGGSGIWLVKGNVKAQSLLQPRMKETAGLDIPSYIGKSHKGKWVHVSREFHNLFTMQRHTCWKHKAVTFQQICVETEKLAPVLKISRVENPESEMRRYV